MVDFSVPGFKKLQDLEDEEKKRRSMTPTGASSGGGSGAGGGTFAPSFVNPGFRGFSELNKPTISAQQAGLERPPETQITPISLPPEVKVTIPPTTQTPVTPPTTTTEPPVTPPQPKVETPPTTQTSMTPTWEYTSYQGRQVPIFNDYFDWKAQTEKYPNISDIFKLRSVPPGSGSRPYNLTPLGNDFYAPSTYVAPK